MQNARLFDFSQVSSHLDLDAFVEHIYQQSNKTLMHHLITKAQARFYKNSKASLDTETVLIQGDFSENYSVCYPKESRNLHFRKTHITLHPMVAYLKHDDQVQTFTFLIVSDCLEHNANSFFAFKNVVIRWITERHPNINKALFFTNGAGSLYKNRKTSRTLPTVRKTSE